jgi:flavorubredoxin
LHNVPTKVSATQRTTGDPMTSIDEIADGLFRISTPVDTVPGGFTYGQYLIRDDQPLLFHTGPKSLFEATLGAIATVLPPESLRYVGFSHVETDECGALNNFLAVAPHATPFTGMIGARVSARDFSNRPVRGLAENEPLNLGKHTVRWFDAPHVPHGWECGYLSVDTLHALLCGDLFTQPGSAHPALTQGDILGPSEAMRARSDYYAHGPNTNAVLEKLAATAPRILACMHGAAWQGDGASLLRELSRRLGATP